MRTTERHTTRPIGLTRFLVSHRGHGDGFETQKDRSAVTVICRGCESSFSFLTSAEGYGARDVDAALTQLASPNGSSDGAGNGAGEPPAEREERRPEPPPAPPPPPPPPESHPGSARRLPPPGPFARRRRRTPSLAERLQPPVEDAARRASAVVNRRWRPIAMAALGLGGAYVLIALSLGGQPSSSQTGAAGGSDVPTTPGPVPTATTGSVADDARTLQTFDAGGPDVQDVAVPAARFQVALPPDWQRTAGADGRSVLRPNGGGAQIDVLSRPRGTLGIGQIADEAAAFLAMGIPPGTKVERLASSPVGSLMAVARSSGADMIKTAYIGVSGSTSYLAVRSLSPDASALVRLQADGIVSSFEPAPADTG